MPFTGRVPAKYIPHLPGFLQLPCRGITMFIPFLFFVARLYGQTPFPPPNRLQVYAAQELAFGSFFTGAFGGTVNITPEGNRTVTGTVTALASSPGMPAVFDVRLTQGRMVHILFPGSASLTRIGGGESMTVTGFVSDKQGNNFVTTAAHPFVNPVKVGATLHVGNIAENPPGDYVGSFTVTFVQE